MPNSEVTYVIWIQSPDASWAQLGTDVSSGVFVDPDTVSHTHRFPGGSSTMTFVINRQGDLPWPDIRAGASLYATVNGVSSWSGRIKAAPRSRGEVEQITVEAEGWYEHLKDDVRDRVFIACPISEAKDSRTIPGISGLYAGNTSPAFGDGQVSITHPAATPIQTNQFNGWYVDLGPNNTVKTAVLSYATSGNSTSTTWYAFNDTTNGDGTVRGEDMPGAVGNTISSSVSGTIQGTFATARRIFGFFTHTPAAYTPAADVWIRITNLKLATDASYLSMGMSALLAADVIKWGLLNMCPKISTDHSLIQSGWYPISEYPGTRGFKTTVDMIEDVTPYDGYQFLLTPEAVPRAVYRPKPTTPRWTISDADGNVDDGGADDLSTIFNRVIVRYTDVYGVEGNVTVNAASTSYLNRLGITRTTTLDAGAVMDSGAATQIGNVFLAEHSSPPFAGTVSISGTIEEYGTGARTPVGQVTVGDIVVLSDLVDPDTGAWGRRAVITDVEYTLSTNTTKLTLDGGNQFLDRLLFLMQSGS